MPRKKTVGLGPANDSDTTKLHRPPGLRWFDSGAFNWDPTRPLSEQWPWSGNPDDRVIRAGAPEAIGMTPRQMRARQAEADRIEDEIRADALVVTDDAPEAGEAVECTAPHDGECQPARWGNGPRVCVVPLRAPADPTSLLADVRECTPAELEADRPPADVAAAVERIAEMAGDPSEEQR